MAATPEAMVADAVVTLGVVAPAATVVARLDFEAWYLREHPKVVAALIWVAGDPHLAADAADEAFARACADWRRVGDMTSPSAIRLGPGPMHGQLETPIRRLATVADAPRTMRTDPRPVAVPDDVDDPRHEKALGASIGARALPRRRLEDP